MAQKKTQEISQLAKQLRQPESKVILDEMTSMAESPEYKQSAPPETQQQLTNAIQQAKGMYDRETTKNEWLEVAQTLAGAVAQYGAARQAGDRYASTINPAAGNIDYGARTGRAQKDYLESVRQAEGVASTTRQGWQDTERQKQDKYSQDFRPLSERLRNAQQIESDESRAQREAALQLKRDEKDRERSDLQERKFQDQQLAQQEKDLQKKEEAMLTLVNQMANDPEMRKADREKIQSKYGTYAAQAGIDPQRLVDIREQAKDEGFLGTGFFRKEDKQKSAAAIQDQLVAPIRTQLDAIRSRRDALRSGQQPAPAVSSTEKAPAAAGKDPQIEKYAKDYSLDYEAAKKVLVGRGYQPKE